MLGGSLASCARSFADAGSPDTVTSVANAVGVPVADADNIDTRARSRQPYNCASASGVQDSYGGYGRLFRRAEYLGGDSQDASRPVHRGFGLHAQCSCLERSTRRKALCERGLLGLLLRVLHGCCRDIICFHF